MRSAGHLLLLMFAGLVSTAQAADEVVIYRCTDGSGHLTLRDTPCRKDQKQQTRTMVRPRDPLVTPESVARLRPSHADNPSHPESSPITPVLVIQPPRPMYECTAPDGTAYTSDNGEGNPRWVPFWTLGYPIARLRGRGEIGNDRLNANGMHAIGVGPDFIGTTSGTSGITVQGIDNTAIDRTTIDSGAIDRTGLDTAGLGVDLRLHTRRLQFDAHSRVRPRYYGNALYGGGTWVRDTCYALPQTESCARLSERRDAINRRFFNAMPSERDALTVEERGVNARIANDCGAY